MDDRKRIKFSFILYGITAVAWGIMTLIELFVAKSYSLASAFFIITVLFTIITAAYYKRYQNDYVNGNQDNKSGNRTNKK